MAYSSPWILFVSGDVVGLTHLNSECLVFAQRLSCKIIEGLTAEVSSGPDEGTGCLSDSFLELATWHRQVIERVERDGRPSCARSRTASFQEGHHRGHSMNVNRH